jgi:aminoglycoside N3'-acetyltransferase
VADRITPGFPHDLMRLPYSGRTPIPGRVFLNVLAHCDGKSTLQTAIKKAEWETGIVLSEKDVKLYIFTVVKLAEAGYLSLTNRNTVTREQVVKALIDVGVNSGDLLLFHSGKSAIGQIKGGDDTVIDALLEVVGDNGTVLMPAFTRPYIAFEGRVNKSRRFRPFNPFNPENTDNIVTGSIPKALMKRPGALRSRHATHSWVGIGPRAKECLGSHEMLDPPASKNSPMGFAHEFGGKVVMLGCGTGSNTFLHYIETRADAPYLKKAVVKCLNGEGEPETHIIPKHLPGRRNFYDVPPEESRFYKAAAENGLTIKQSRLGMGLVYSMDLKELYDIGMKLIGRDSEIML